MNNKELIKKKNQLLNEDWTEDLHHGLQKLEPECAKQIVESMDDSEIYSKINIRHCQEDYIADYLDYLWEISKLAYWKNVIISLDVEVGILWSDNMSYFERLCNNIIPDDVLKAVFDFAIDSEKDSHQDLDAIGCVIKAQVEKFGRMDIIKKYISDLNNDVQDFANKRVFSMINQTCKYTF